MALRRGFKAEAERIAKDIWNAMQLKPDDCMEVLELARHVGCVVHSADRLVDIGRLEELKRIQDDAFFACTFKLPDDRFAIVFNPLVQDSRRNSDVAHEVSHIVLEHRLSSLKRLGDVAFLSCEQQQEEEARWLSGCLLLPRFVLYHDVAKRMTAQKIAVKRTVSIEMVEFRLRVTGVARQLAAGRRGRTR